MRTLIKICGITRAMDLHQAAASGADAVGLVFHERSPRAIKIKTARELCLQAPPFLTCVGLFLDESQAFIEHVLSQVPLDLLQFHGDESPEDCCRYGKRYIKAIAMKGRKDPVAYANRYTDASAFLLDGHGPGEMGGRGLTFDWKDHAGLGKPIILAGGLNTSNVAGAIQSAKPHAVDVSSGVESATGIKDADMIRSFCSEVRRAELL